MTARSAAPCSGPFLFSRSTSSSSHDALGKVRHIAPWALDLGTLDVSRELHVRILEFVTLSRGYGRGACLAPRAESLRQVLNGVAKGVDSLISCKYLENTALSVGDGLEGAAVVLDDEQRGRAKWRNSDEDGDAAKRRLMLV